MSAKFDKKMKCKYAEEEVEIQISKRLREGGEEVSEVKRERGGSVLRRRIPLVLFMDKWAALTNIIGPILFLFLFL